MDNYLLKQKYCGIKQCHLQHPPVITISRFTGSRNLPFSVILEVKVALELYPQRKAPKKFIQTFPSRRWGSRRSSLSASIHCPCYVDLALTKLSSEEHFKAVPALHRVMGKKHEKAVDFPSNPIIHKLITRRTIGQPWLNHGPLGLRNHNWINNGAEGRACRLKLVHGSDQQCAGLRDKLQENPI